MVGSLKENLKKINAKIASENPSQKNSPRIVAVSKKQPESKIRELNDLGVIDFAENYLQEALLKIESLKKLNLRWHFIGQIQSKKIKDIVGRFDLIHSVCRVSELEKMSLIAAENNVIQDFLIQINIANESTKSGVKPGELDAFVAEAVKINHLNLKGLMIFPPLSDSEEESLKWFSQGQDLFLKYQKQLGEEFCHLSMGTSGDFHLAVRQGSTDLRIGEILMGSRTQ